MGISLVVVLAVFQHMIATHRSALSCVASAAQTRATQLCLSVGLYRGSRVSYNQEELRVGDQILRTMSGEN